MPGKEIKGRSKIATYRNGGDVKGKYPSKGMNSLASERPDVAKKIMGYKKGKLVKKYDAKKDVDKIIRFNKILENTKAKPTELKKGGSAKKGTYKTKDGRTVKKGLYYYMNKRKKAGTSRSGTGTVSAKALKRSAKTAKKTTKKA